MKYFVPLLLAGFAVVGPTLNVQAQPPVSQRIAVKPEPDRGRDIRASIWTDRKDYRVGDKVRISYRVNRDSYVYIFSTDADGKTRQIFPNYYDQDNAVRADRTYSIPSRGYSLEATPPRGIETISIVAVKERGRGYDNYRRFSKSNPFPESSGADVAVRGLVVKPTQNNNYAKDSTQIQIRRKDWDGGGSSSSSYARLRVDSNPSGANVFIDNNFVGTTPLSISDIRPGRRTVTIHRQGYSAIYRTVSFERGETERLSESLRPERPYGW